MKGPRVRIPSMYGNTIIGLEGMKSRVGGWLIAISDKH